MNREEQLQWEARWARPAAIAAFLAGALLIVSAMLFFPEDREGIERHPDLLLSIDEQSGAYLASAVLGALAGLLLVGVFLYLFRATLARGGGVPPWFQYLVIAAPVLYAVSTVAGAFEAIDLADDFASEEPIRGEKGADRADELGGANPVLVALATAGTVGVAFLFVMLPLRARRVGLLTPFMGILGVIAGALVVFQLTGVSSVIQAFWLGALGLLFLGRWPGGRGPAWESGQPEPWPSAAQRRGLVPMPGEEEPAKLDPTPPEPEPVPERPASRKRRRKR
ncbi:MAG TPA: hypothetical protein VFY47_07060 [Thermoleophilaceae bacterium]|nr:hypothetical protein [Thermoleophilaceae bacterium]